MPNSLFDSQTISIPCPKCGKDHAKSVAWLKANKHIACACGGHLDIDRSQFLTQIAKAEKQMRDLLKNFR